MSGSISSLGIVVYSSKELRDFSDLHLMYVDAPEVAPIVEIEDGETLDQSFTKLIEKFSTLAYQHSDNAKEQKRTSNLEEFRKQYWLSMNYVRTTKWLEKQRRIAIKNGDNVWSDLLLINKVGT